MQCPAAPGDVLARQGMADTMIAALVLWEYIVGDDTESSYSLEEYEQVTAAAPPGVAAVVATGTDGESTGQPVSLSPTLCGIS